MFQCVVIGLQSTGEARTLEQLEECGGELTDFVSTALYVNHSNVLTSLNLCCCDFRYSPWHKTNWFSEVRCILTENYVIQSSPFVFTHNFMFHVCLHCKPLNTVYEARVATNACSMTRFLKLSNVKPS